VKHLAIFRTNVFVKYELFQKTGSFKVRGAFNKLLSLSAEERKRGVVAISGGNHAQAVAYASNVLDVDAVVLMPQTTPQNYLERHATTAQQLICNQRSRMLLKK
jgi:threonine dehydratase